MDNIKYCSDYECNNYIKNDNQIIKLLNELKSIDNILIDTDFHSYQELKNINLLIELKLKFDYSIKDDYKRIYNYCLKEKEIIKSSTNIPNAVTDEINPSYSSPILSNIYSAFLRSSTSLSAIVAFCSHSLDCKA